MGRFPAIVALLAALCAPLAFAQAPKPPPDAFTNPAKGNCIACHQLPAVPALRTRADVGPALEGARMRELGRAGIRDVIEDPMRANPQTVMPPFGRHQLLDRAQIDSLVEYLHALP